MSTKSDLHTHLSYLCNVIQSRPTGSPNNQKAVAYIEDILVKNGLSVTKQELPCMDWKNNGAFLTINSRSCSVKASDYSAPCCVTAPYVCFDTLEDLQNAPLLTDKILIIYGELCKEPLAPKNYPWYNPETHQTILSAIEAKKPLALITVSFHPTLPISIIEDGDFNIPCAVVSMAELPFLLHHTTSLLSLKIDTKRIPTTSYNLIAHYGKGSKKIVFSAHLDTKPTTSGALDDGSGVATLLALSALVQSTNCPYEIEFVFFNGEDYYNAAGESNYVNAYLTAPSEYAFAVNVDGVGLNGSKNSYSFYACEDLLVQSVQNIGHHFDTLEEVNPWPQGDHTLFAMSGIPAIALTSSQIFDIYNDIIHTEKDTLELIDFDALTDVVSFCLQLLQV